LVRIKGFNVKKFGRLLADCEVAQERLQKLEHLYARGEVNEQQWEALGGRLKEELAETDAAIKEARATLHAVVAEQKNDLRIWQDEAARVRASYETGLLTARQYERRISKARRQEEQAGTELGKLATVVEAERAEQLFVRELRATSERGEFGVIPRAAAFLSGLCLAITPFLPFCARGHILP